MKRILVVLMMLLSTAAWAGEKEELQLKASFLQEHIEKLSLQVNIIRKDYEESQAALKETTAKLDAMKKTEDEKTKAAPKQEGK